MASKAQPDLFVDNQTALAAIFGVSAGTITGWKQNGAPKRTRQGFSVNAWVQWRIARVSMPTGMADIAAQLKQAQLELVKLKLERERGGTIPAEQAERHVLAAVQWLIGVLERAPLELAAELTGKGAREAKKITEEYFNRTRRNLIARGKWPVTCGECSEFFQQQNANKKTAG